MSEQIDVAERAAAPAVYYPVLIGLRDTDGGKSLEMAIMLDDRAPHSADAPHMIVQQFLRANWSKIVAAAELDHNMATGRATLDRIEEQGGLQHAATLAS